MQLEDAEADATEDELAAERSAPPTLVKSFERRRPARKPFPEHLLRERIVVAAPQSCPYGSVTSEGNHSRTDL
jgi:transposase